MIAIKRKPAKERASAARSELTPELAAEVTRLGGLELEFIEHDKFARGNPDRAANAVLTSAEEPTTVGDTDEARRLTAEEESTWFEQMNWFKYWADRLRKQLQRRPSAELVARIDRLLQASTKIRNRLIQMNLRLVPFVARNFVSPHHSLADLISDGQITLIRSVEKFDFSRGFRFSTYATWPCDLHWHATSRMRDDGEHGSRTSSKSRMRSVPRSTKRSCASRLIRRCVTRSRVCFRSSTHVSRRSCARDSVSPG